MSTSVLGEVVTFLRHLLERHDTMATSLAAILGKLDDQGKQIAAQGAQIDKLIADRDAKEQADMQRISDLMDANSAAAKANADKLTAALTDDGGADKPEVQQPGPQPNASTAVNELGQPIT